MSPIQSLVKVFADLEDPHRSRGVRHPFSGIVVLTILGTLARIHELEPLVRWATIHWHQLKAPLGFDRDRPPCATTISRTLAICSFDEFQSTLQHWLQSSVLKTTNEKISLVGRKFAKPGIADRNRPLYLLNAMVDELRVVFCESSSGANDIGASTRLRKRLKQMLVRYPMLHFVVSEVNATQRPLIELVRIVGRDKFVSNKQIQDATLLVLEQCFLEAKLQESNARSATEQTEFVANPRLDFPSRS